MKITNTYNFDPNISIHTLFEFINKFDSKLIDLTYTSNLPQLTIKFDIKHQPEIESILR